MKTIREHVSRPAPGVAVVPGLASIRLALVVATLAAGAFASDREIPASTRKMADRLRTIAKTADPSRNQFLSAERAAMYEAAAKEAGDVGSRFGARIQASLEYSNSGQPAKALAVTQELRKAAADQGLKVSERTMSLIRRCEVTAYLRLGELENCCASKSADACLVPIRGGGIHTLPAGSRGAIAVLQESLESNPDDLASLWLLNVAHMTLGEYPQAVPEKWLIPTSTFASDYDIHPFPEIAGSVGLGFDGLAGGAIMEDFDGDGWLDVMASSMGLDQQLRYFHNEGDGQFAERTDAALLTGEVGGLNICQADYDNDGDADVLVLRGAWMHDEGHYPNSLLRNEGNGTFTDVTEAAGLLSFHPTQAAAWGDFDDDGWLDLFIGNEHMKKDPHPCELFHNNRDGTFTECAARSGITEREYVKGVAWGDYDNDGRIDLFVSRLGAENLLYHNDGPAAAASDAAVGFAWKFTDVTKRAGVALPIKSFATWFFDYDNDGWLDLWVGGYDIAEPLADVAALALGRPGPCERGSLYRNKHDGTFEDVTVAAHLDKLRLPMGANFGDLDNDGFLDFYLGTGNPDLRTLLPNRMLRNAEGKFFQDVTTSGNFGHLQKGHGIAFGDVDNDGDQDLWVVMGGAFEGDRFRRLLFLNPGHDNHWVTLRCEGTKSNRSAVGARVKVVVETETGTRDIHCEVNTGGSFGASSLQTEIGLGRAVRIQSVQVTWPATNQTENFTGAEMDRVFRAREGDGQLVPIVSKTIDLARFVPR